MFKKPGLRTICRCASLLLFCCLLAFAHEGTLWHVPADLYLRADPLAGLMAPAAAREIIFNLWPAWLVLLSALLFGRIFCGWLCPMGATLDAGGWLVRKLGPRRKPRLPNSLRLGKFLLLALIFCAAFFGVNLFFWGSPIALATRLYALTLEPWAHWLYNTGLVSLAPILEKTGAGSLLYNITEPGFYRGLLFVIAFWLALFMLEWLASRFWCRYLCPAGAVLGLLARFGIFRRKVKATCTDCGICAKNCPSAILDKPLQMNPGECLVCGNCRSVCPKKAVSFGFGQGSRAYSPKLVSRRAFLGASACGAALACFTPLVARAERKLVRPPGALPEQEFLAACLRCGECMAACPDHALQPALFGGGAAALFSPRLEPYSGGCSPDCCACGHVCPSHAILPLSLAQKRWAKIGTAVVQKDTCLAWHDDKRCMVCKENCPYNAVDVISREGYIAPVPIVHEKYCYGCGFCQKACPTSPASIMVEAASVASFYNCRNLYS